MGSTNLTEQLRVFRKVVDKGSFAAAAKDLRVTPAWAARQVSNLERNLDTTLLIRSTRSLHLTDTGHTCYKSAQRVSDELEMLREEIRSNASNISGTVRLNLPTIFALSGFSKKLLELPAKHPNLNLEIEVSDRFIDLLDDEADIVVRITHELKDSTAIARKLGQLPRILCASQAYLDQAPKLTGLDDIEEHRTLVFSGLRAQSKWYLTDGHEQRWITPIPAMSANNSYLLKSAAIEGQGIAFLPKILIDQELLSGSLVQIANLADAAPLNIFALRPPISRLPSRIQIVWDALAKCIGNS